jgi:hypothetical protein
MRRIEFAANPRPIGPKIGKISGNIPAVFGGALLGRSEFP